MTKLTCKILSFVLFQIIVTIIFYEYTQSYTVLLYADLFSFQCFRIFVLEYLFLLLFAE